jgi:pimeloyl-ACP methyl ester carboxylesterase
VTASSPMQLEGVEHRYADLPGVRAHYAEAGDPAGDAVLLLHGWPQHWASWSELIPPLAAAGYRVIVPDLRGFGWSQAPGTGYDGETFARDQVALLDELGIEAAHVLGHDWGGWVTFLLGTEHPQRVRRMIACNTPHPWPRQRPSLLLEAWRSWYAALNAAPGAGPATVIRIAHALLTRGNVRDPFSPEELSSYIGQFRDPQRAKAARDLYRYYFRAFREALSGNYDSKRLAAPTLLLFGARDIWVSPRVVEHSEDYLDRAAEMTVELVPDSGHFIINEKPELVIERALSHFSS